MMPSSHKAAEFFSDWPADDYPAAVDECVKDLRRCIPLRNLGRSYRWAARDALEQARYLGLTSIEGLPPTVRRPASAGNRIQQPVRGQVSLPLESPPPLVIGGVSQCR